MGSYLRLVLSERWNYKQKAVSGGRSRVKVQVQGLYLVEEAEHGHALGVGQRRGQVSVVVLHVNDV